MFEVGKKYRNPRNTYPDHPYECLLVYDDYGVFKKKKEFSLDTPIFLVMYTELWEEVKPAPDSIDWSHVHSSFKWLTRDQKDFVQLHQTKPTPAFGSWGSHGKIASGRSFSSYKQGDVDWKDSLIERPEE